MKSEARQLVEDRVREIAAMPIEDLACLEEHPVEDKIDSPSGKRYRVKTYSFWDMEPYESDLYIRAKVTGRGLRLFQRYYGVAVRSPNTELGSGDAEQVDVSPTWTEIATWVIFVLIVVVIPVALMTLGVIFLISKVL